VRSLKGWGGLRLARVPELDDVESVFRQAAVTWKRSLGATTADEAVNQLGWPVRVRDMAEAGTTIRSLLVPLLSGGFSIVVNGEHQPTESRILWLVAHEFAHSLFYTGQAPPRRIITHTPQEEDFCDRFADLARRPLPAGAQ
jgi:hypothetical protein